MRWRGAPWAVLGEDASACSPIWSVAGALPVSVTVSVLLTRPPGPTDAVIEPGFTCSCPALSR
jgi:hypothetical protein